jgi:tellurite methyltransferase
VDHPDDLDAGPDGERILFVETRQLIVPPTPSADLRSQFGEIDIYLFDQILKGRFDRRPRVMDAGVGDGRNLIYFLRHGFTCFGIDRESAAIARVRTLAATLAPGLPAGNFQVGELDQLPWEDQSMDAVICSAVLHFASDTSHFGRMVEEMWRVLAPDGLFFARLASTIGLEDRVGEAGQRVRLPDGTERFVVDEAMLQEWTGRLGGEWLDPLKTTNVQQQRCMTTWCVRKPGTSATSPLWR